MADRVFPRSIDVDYRYMLIGRPPNETPSIERIGPSTTTTTTTGSTRPRTTERKREREREREREKRSGNKLQRRSCRTECVKTRYAGRPWNGGYPFRRADWSLSKRKINQNLKKKQKKNNEKSSAGRTPPQDLPEYPEPRTTTTIIMIIVPPPPKKNRPI